MATYLNEGPHAGEFIRSEAPGYRSRENVMVTGDAALAAGTVLGMVLASSITQEFSGTGNGVLTPDATTPLLADAKGAAIARDAEVSGYRLGWVAGVGLGGRDVGREQLAARGIISR